MSTFAIKDTSYDTLMFILEHQRPHLSKPEEYVINQLIVPLKKKGKLLRDSFGNYVFDVPTPPDWKKIIWSCHTDTVHFQCDGPPGVQPVDIGKDGRIFIPEKAKKYASCLGADDGAGLWLLLEMIDAGVPGRYIFHRGEEKGCVGSRHIATHVPEAVAGYDCAIALDRRDFRDIITHQRGQRRCSEGFAQSVAEACNWTEQLRADPTGAYTDTAEYSEIVPECTNISVGYQGNHQSAETLHLPYLLALRKRLLGFDGRKLLILRDPAKEREEKARLAAEEAQKVLDFRKTHGYYDTKQRQWMKWCDVTQDFIIDTKWETVSYSSRASAGGGRVRSFSAPSSPVVASERPLVDKLTSFLNRHPRASAEMLLRFGFTESEFLECMKEAHGKDFTMDKTR